MVSEGEVWVDLVAPDEATLRAALPDDVHDVTIERILRFTGEPRPRLETRDTYLFGVLVFPTVPDGAASVDFQEIDIVATTTAFVTIRQRATHGEPAGFEEVRAHADHSGAGPGMCLYYLIDQIAEQFLDLIDFYDDRIEQLEDSVATLPSSDIRRRIADYRHEMLHVRRMLTPTRDAARSVLDDRVDLGGEHRMFPRPVELHFADTYDKLLRATDNLDLTRDLLAGVRDYHQAEIANEQNEVTKRLTAIASLLLLPTFIVGLYGQNFIHMPELRWRYGYQFSWTLIIVTTVLQFWYFRRKRWI